MVVSYTWGVVVFQATLQNPWLSDTGLVLLIVGVLWIVLCEIIAQDWIASGRGNYTTIPSSSSTSQQQQSQVGGNRSRTAEATAAATNNGTSTSSSSLKSYAVGVLYSLGVVAPFWLHCTLCPTKSKGLRFLPSFCIGCGLASPLVFGIYCCVQPMPSLHVRQALLMGLCSGLLWNTGNLLSILAIPILTYGVAYPIMQCAILISGLWGIYYFGEISDYTTDVGSGWRHFGSGSMRKAKKAQSGNQGAIPCKDSVIARDGWTCRAYRKSFSVYTLEERPNSQ